METTREPLATGVEFPASALDSPPAVTFSNTLALHGPTAHCGNATATLALSPDSRTTWRFTAADLTVDKALGADVAAVSAGAPSFAENSRPFQLASCWLRTDEQLILCADGRRRGTKQPLAVYVQTPETEYALAESDIPLQKNEEIRLMAAIPHHTAMLRRFSEKRQTAREKEAAEKLEFACHLICLVSTLGNVFFWKVTDAARPPDAAPVEPDGIACVWKLRRELGPDATALAAAQVAPDALCVVTASHCVLLRVAPDRSLTVRQAQLEHPPLPGQPIAILPHAKPPKHARQERIVSSIADIAYPVGVDDETREATVAVGYIDKELKQSFGTLKVPDAPRILGVFPLQPYERTRRVAVATPSQLRVLCVRFRGLELARLRLERAVAAVPLPAPHGGLHAFAVCALLGEGASEARLPAAVDYVTLRCPATATGGQQTSIVEAIRRTEAAAPVDPIQREVERPVTETDEFLALRDGYLKMKACLGAFPHTLGDCQPKGRPAASWGAVKDALTALEMALAAFCRGAGRRVAGALEGGEVSASYDESGEARENTAENEKVLSLLRSIREISKFLKTQAVHAKTFAKKATVLRPREAAEGDRPAFVAMDRKYPRRTIDSADYSPWPLRPPAARSL